MIFHFTVQLLFPGLLKSFSLFFLDINECFPGGLLSEHERLAHICHNDANCTNTKGSYYCDCLAGYSGDGITCQGSSTFFPLLVVCIDWIWFFSISYSKRKNFGQGCYFEELSQWKRGAFHIYFVSLLVNMNLGTAIFFPDIDECSPGEISNDYIHLAHNCDTDANCTNTKGSFFCTCKTGFSGDGVTCVGAFLI